MNGGSECRIEEGRETRKGVERMECAQGRVRVLRRVAPKYNREYEVEGFDREHVILEF